MIVIMASTVQIGRQVVDDLLDRGARVRLIVREQAKIVGGWVLRPTVAKARL